MKNFKSFISNIEESAVEMTGGGKTVSLKKGEKVTFTHHATGKPATGTFVKKVRRGAHQYAHLEMPDNTAMHVPVHHISGAKDVSESEEIDEISKQAAGRYVKAASKDLKNVAFAHGDFIGSYPHDDTTSGKRYMDSNRRMMKNREKGIERAVGKLTKD